MESNHPCLLLFIEPKSPPSKEPLEDEYTRKVDVIFSKLLKPDYAYRGCHETPFGVSSDTWDYIHPSLSIVSNSLATYYIRHHRLDISDEQLAWIDHIYDIIHTEHYPILERKEIYFLRVFQYSRQLQDEKIVSISEAQTLLIKVEASKENVEKTLSDTLFQEITEKEFLEEVGNCIGPKEQRLGEGKAFIYKRV